MSAYRFESRDLGALEERFGSSRSARPIIVFFAVFGLPGIALLSGFQSGKGQIFDGSATTNGIIGAALLGFAIYCCVLVLRKATLRVDVHTNGIAWSERGVRRTFLWREIAGITSARTSRTVAGVEANLSHRYTILLANGRALVATRMLGDVGRLATRIEAELAQRLLPEMKTKLDAGERVSFDAFALDAEGIRLGSDLLRWDDLDAIDVEDGTITLKSKSGSRTIEWAKTTNAKLFLELASERLRAARGRL